MKFLIAGLGSIGKRHLHNLLELGERDILLYRTHKGALGEDNLEDFPVETELHTALAHKPDAVIISNPTSLHLDVAIPAAEAGCHILLEKPISHSMDQTEELQTAVHNGGGQVLVGYQFRFHPSLQIIRKLLSSNAIGQPLSVQAHWGEYLPGWHPWEDYRKGYSARKDLGGGVILTLSHPIDYLRWLLGKINLIWSFAGRSGEFELDVEDNAVIGLEFDSNAIGSLHLNYNQQPPVHRLEIVGSQGTIRWEYSDGSVMLYQAKSNEWETFPLRSNFVRNDMFRKEMAHFLDIVHNNVIPLCSLKDGIECLRLALAALQSAETGQLINPQINCNQIN